jgi:hypothetical protein
LLYVWKKKYANLGATELRELRVLREENAKLKRLVANLTLDKHILGGFVRKELKAGTQARARGLDARLLRRDSLEGLSGGADRCRYVSRKGLGEQVLLAG